MKEKFIDREFGERSLGIIAQANQIITEYQTQGFDLSVRQLFYQFVVRNILANSQKNYDSLQATIVDARMAGLIDWDTIKDRGRITHQTSTSPDVKSYLQLLNEHYRRDKWHEQPAYVEVMVEKQALEGVLLPVCQRWDVPFTCNKGYSSASTTYERAKILQSKRDVDRKQAHVIYLGDHDPSGIDMSRDVSERLSLFSDGVVHVHRVALNMDQVRRLALPENPAKLSDSRAPAYIAEFGEHSWELDAIEPTTLASIVEHQIRALVDATRWQRDLANEERDQDRLQDIIDRL